MTEQSRMFTYGGRDMSFAGIPIAFAARHEHFPANLSSNAYSES